jgi:endonuclease/exonuclease/phosphatase family metal-dependent hydrolase
MKPSGKVVRILNWNTQHKSPRSKYFQPIVDRIQKFNPDIICLTEAYPQTLPEHGYTLMSDVSGWYLDKRGARKVLLWSHISWEKTDTFGAASLPTGRFIRAITRVRNVALTVVGVCMPYHNYRVDSRYYQNPNKAWQGMEEYLDGLHRDILPDPLLQQRTIILGDFNLQIPPRGYPSVKNPINENRERTFELFQIPTAGIHTSPQLTKSFIDHVALTPDLSVTNMFFISRLEADGSELSDHDGVCVDITYTPTNLK